MGWLKNLVAKIVAKKVAKNLDLQEGKMEDGKKWWQSKTIWSDVLTTLVGVWGVAAPVLADHGVNLPPIPPVLLTFLGAMGIYGRKVATKPIV